MLFLQLNRLKLIKKDSLNENIKIMLCNNYEGMCVCTFLRSNIKFIHTFWNTFKGALRQSIISEIFQCSQRGYCIDNGRYCIDNKC